jgi:murein DD-endopeptidase MepM/ murein hydrolase activator NlpD
MIVPMQFTHFGYRFGDPVSGGKIHSGVDLNYGYESEDDLGMPVKSMADGRVVESDYVSGGFGNMIIVHHPQLNVWTRYAHLQRRDVETGQTVIEGQLIGTVGATGGNWGPHLHWDVIIKRLNNWTDYTNGFTRAKLLEYYVDPLEFVLRGVPAAPERDVDRDSGPQPESPQPDRGPVGAEPSWFTRTTRPWAEDLLSDVDRFIEDPNPYRILEVIRKATNNRR